MSKGKKRRQKPAVKEIQRGEAETVEVVESIPDAEQSEDAKTAPAVDEAALKAEYRAKFHKRHMKALRGLIIRIVALALVVYILFFHLVGITIMPNADMVPRIDAGDMVLFYRLEHNIRAQDVIVFRKPTASLEQSYHHQAAGETARAEKSAFRKALDWLGFADPADPPMTTFVCSAAAGPGDTVEITESEQLIVNGNSVIENNIFYSTPLYEGFVEYPLKLGEGQYFVLADYRNGGADSRFFGAVNADEILGTVITILRRNNL